MEITAVQALASYITTSVVDYIIPDALDMNVAVIVAEAVFFNWIRSFPLYFKIYLLTYLLLIFILQ
jgi:hypothetical protein